MSRPPWGEVATTTSGISQRGASLSRVTGPPASRSSSNPVLNVRSALSWARTGIGFRGTDGCDSCMVSTLVRHPAGP